MNRQAQGVVMLLLGGAALRASLTDLHLRYVKEALQPFLVVASVLLVLGGAMTLWYEWQQRSAAAGTPGDDEHDAGDADEDHAGDADEHDAGDDGHGHGQPRVGWLLVLPVLGLLLVAPPALGSYSVSTAGTAGASLSADRVAGLPPLPEHLDPVPLTVLDYVARTLWGAQDTLDGRRLRLTGFLVTGEDGEPYLARLVLSCCAADARPLKVGLAGDGPAGLPDDTWVEVVGSYVDRTGVDPINQATIPYLAVEAWREVPAPRQPYE